MLNLAEIAYEAWWKEAQDHFALTPHRSWADLPAGLKRAWEAALAAAFEADAAREEEED